MKTLFIALLALAGTCSAALPEIKAETNGPVTPDSMAICGLKCTIKSTIYAAKKGDTKETRIIVLDDVRAGTAWRDESGGIGTRLVIHFPAKIPAEMEGQVPFYGFDLISGDHRSHELWAAASRIKKMRFWYNGKAVCDFLLPDSYDWISASFTDIMVRSGDQCSLEILEVYPGTTSKTLVLSELVLMGAH